VIHLIGLTGALKGLCTAFSGHMGQQSLREVPLPARDLSVIRLAVRALRGTGADAVTSSQVWADVAVSVRKGCRKRGAI